MFKKLYVSEYDQYGGEPYGTMIGLYEFENTQDDINWLSIMGKIATASHAPFIAAISPKFFGCKSAEDLSDIKNLTALLDHPKYGKWNQFRKTEQCSNSSTTSSITTGSEAVHSSNSSTFLSITGSIAELSEN